MKIYIKCTKEAPIEIKIDFCFSYDDGITAAFDGDSEDFNLEEEIEDMVYEKFQSFMHQVMSSIRAEHYAIIKGPEFSNNERSKSCYVTLCKEGEYTEKTVKFVLNVRISDHRLHNTDRDKKKKQNRWDRFAARDQHYQDELKNYRNLNTENPESMRYGFTEIFVNGNKFKTYKPALNHILKRIKEQF